MTHPRRTVSYGAMDLMPKLNTPLDKLEESGQEERPYSMSTSDLPDELCETPFDMVKSTESLRRIMSPPYLSIFPSVESMASDDKSNKRASIGGETKSRFSHKQRITVGMLACANLASTVVFSCIAPFFPQEAKKKGATETEIGFIFGIFELIIFIVSPLFGRYITKIGSKFMYGFGLFVTGVTAILFGLLNLCPPGVPFVVLCFVIRSFEAVGDAAFITASFAITAYAFPNRVATVIGLLETFSGLGFTVGPPLGGALFELGGFQLPFWVLGCFLILAGLSSLWVIPKQDDQPTGKSQGSVYGLLRYPEIVLMACCIIVTAATLSFLDPTLQPHLESFNLSPFLVGLMFLLTGGFYTLTAPFWGYLIDKKNCDREVMILGSVCSCIALMFIGPSPIFGIQKTLWLVGISQVMLGFGIGALYIPPFHYCLISLRKRGFDESFGTYGLVSGIFQAAMSFGAFMGPTLGGVAVEHIGFAWSATFLSALFVIVGITLTVYLIRDNRKNKAKNYKLIKRSNESISSLGD